MIDYLTSFPIWFWMIIIFAIVAVGLYKVIKADKIKAGPIEIEEDEEKDKDQSPEIVKQEFKPKKGKEHERD